MVRVAMAYPGGLVTVYRVHTVGHGTPSLHTAPLFLLLTFESERSPKLQRLRPRASQVRDEA